jgi:hypothetical protein
MLTILHKLHVSYPRRSGLVTRCNHLRPIYLKVGTQPWYPDSMLGALIPGGYRHIGGASGGEGDKEKAAAAAWQAWRARVSTVELHPP